MLDIPFLSSIISHILGITENNILIGELMKILKKRDWWCKVFESDVGTMLHLKKEGAFWFNEEYQRPYVWGEKEQQQFLNSLFNEKPIGSLSVVEESHKEDREYIEVVDGRQRLTTLMMFFDSEISYNGYYWKDLDIIEKRYIRNIKFPMLYLSMKGSTKDDMVPMKVKLEYFHGVNFSGVPQSEEHRIEIEKMLEKENEK